MGCVRLYGTVVVSMEESDMQFAREVAQMDCERRGTELNDAMFTRILIEACRIVAKNQSKDDHVRLLHCRYAGAMKTGDFTFSAVFGFTSKSPAATVETLVRKTA